MWLRFESAGAEIRSDRIFINVALIFGKLGTSRLLMRFRVQTLVRVVMDSKIRSLKAEL
jgi:hypothetical protein